MNKGFTKIYKQERELLKQTKSVACYEVYMHLKDDFNYFKTKNNVNEVHDIIICISEYLDIPQRTVKDAIKRLKEVGLISVKKGSNRKNLYSFPILEAIENGIETPVVQEQQNNGNIQDNCQNIEESPCDKEEQPAVEEPAFYNYCEEVEKLLDSDDIITINHILKRGIDYMEFGKTEYEVYATTGNAKIMDIISSYFNYNENERARTDFLYYVLEYNKDYKESVNKQLNECEEYDRYEYNAA